MIKVCAINLVVMLLTASPFLYLVGLILGGDLGADPAKKLSLFSGEWALRFLLLALSASTLARLFVWGRRVIRWRRLLGLWSFFYASLHLLVFTALYVGFNWGVLGGELQKRPYITVGFLAWMLLIPLALTSHSWALRWLGGNAWKWLHQLVYLALLLGLCHLIWQVRSDWFEAVFYSVVGGLLLMERTWYRWAQR